MLVQEVIPPEHAGGWTLIRTYSNIGMLIRQDGTGFLYSEAVDPEDAHRTYTETDIPIEGGDDEDEEEPTEEEISEEND